MGHPESELAFFCIYERFDHPRREIIREDWRAQSIIPIGIGREICEPIGCILELSSFFLTESSFLSFSGSSFFSEGCILHFEFLDEVEE